MHPTLTPGYYTGCTQFTFPEGWKAELTLELVMYQDGLPVQVACNSQRMQSGALCS